MPFFLDLNKNGKREKNEPRSTTNVYGEFKFNNLAPGTYIVRSERLRPSLFDSPTSGSLTVKVTAGKSVDNLAFLVKNVKDQ